MLLELKKRVYLMFKYPNILIAPLFKNTLKGKYSNTFVMDIIYDNISTQIELPCPNIFFYV